MTRLRVLTTIGLAFALGACDGGGAASAGTGGTGTAGSGGTSGSSASNCGNGTLQAGEPCDGTDVDGKTCGDAGAGYGGTLVCAATCTFDTSGCNYFPVCGDGIANGGELCDTAELRGESCQSVDAGFTGGTLACLSDCTFDTTGCTGTAEAACDGGSKDATEVCDGTDFGGRSCFDVGFTSGTLACAANCMSFDTAGCTGGGEPVCGDGVRGGLEQCDGSDNGGTVCGDLDGFVDGTLACGGGCTFNTSGCNPQADADTGYRALISRYCDLMVCGGEYPDHATCQAHTQPCDGRLAPPAGVTDAEMQTCADAIGVAASTAPVGGCFSYFWGAVRLSACRPVFAAGSVQPGGQCNSTDARCVPGSFCSAPSPVCRVCEPYAAQGAACGAGGGECDERDGMVCDRSRSQPICVPLKANGRPCGFGTECESLKCGGPVVCYDFVTGVVDPTDDPVDGCNMGNGASPSCQAIVVQPLGGACYLNAECQAGTYCGSSQCAAFVQIGESCATGGTCRFIATCVAGTCQGVNHCGAGAVDAPCFQSADCDANLYCRGNTCAPYSAIGGLCDRSTGEGCEDGLNCVYDPATSANFCRTPLTQDAPCRVSAECITPLRCIGDAASGQSFCKPLLFNGQVCDASMSGFDCQSGYCDGTAVPDPVCAQPPACIVP